MTDFSKLRVLTPEEVAAMPPEQPDPDYIRRNTTWQAPAGIYDEIDQRRKKQIAKGYDAAHDDQHTKGEIALGEPSEFKSEGPRENLLKAAAMIVAEIERLDRKG